MLAAQLRVEAKHSLLMRLAAARSQTDRLFGIVRPAALYRRPIPERHRIIFYLGHLEAFDWNLLQPHIEGLASFHPQFDHLFAFGIDPVDGGLPSDQPSDWPATAEIQSYMQRIRDTLDSALAGDAFWDFEPFQAATLLNIAIEHRLMHAETLAYMFHQLPFEDKISQSDASVPAAGTVQPRMVEIPTGSATLGLSREDTAAFGWDNEYDAHGVNVPAFEIDRYKVTNGQYLEFLQAGGYEDQSLWTAEDWQWKADQNISHPVFWLRGNEGWFYRGMFDPVSLPLDWPVYVSHAEAAAYARWAGKKLPTESQWHRAAYGSLDGTEYPYPWGFEEPSSAHGNFGFQRWDPAPVNAFPLGRSAFGVDGLLGNGWEWTSSIFAPFDGFAPFASYPGYSANFFDGKHFVIKGGSARTGSALLRRSFRNWFQPHYQYVYAGFRCVSP